MAIIFLFVGLIFLASGGIGLFYTNTHVVSSDALFFLGNLGFGTFALFGLVVLIFLAFFNAEFD